MCGCDRAPASRNFQPAFGKAVKPLVPQQWAQLAAIKFTEMQNSTGGRGYYRVLTQTIPRPDFMFTARVHPTFTRSDYASRFNVSMSISNVEREIYILWL